MTRVSLDAEAACTGATNTVSSPAIVPSTSGSRAWSSASATA